MKILMGILLLDAFTLPYNVQAVHRYLVDTTCLELAKPSNKLSRLSCSDNTAYHCLPDWNFTRDVEVCGRWKWVPRDSCAYLNPYDEYIDVKRCIEIPYWGCSKTAFRSIFNIKFTACYKKTTSPVLSHTTTRIVPLCSGSTGTGSQGPYIP